MILRKRPFLAAAAVAALCAAIVVLFVVIAVSRRPGRAELAAAVSGTAVVVRTSEDATVYLEYGPTRAYGLFTAARGPGRVQRLEPTDLEPGRRYHARAVAVTGSRTLVGPDVTLRAPPGPAFHALRVAGDHLELDGRPWTPRFTWGSCASSYAEEAQVGVNVFMSSNCGDSPQRQAQAAARVGALVIPALDQASVALPTTVAAYLADEPDLAQTPPAQLAADLRAHPDANGLPVFLTLSKLAASAGGRAARPYGDYVSLADCVGIDVYPIFSTGDRSRVGDVADAQRQLQELARGRPTFQWIEATAPKGHPDWRPTPREIEAEAWLAIAGGARALGWWTYGSSPFSVDAAGRTALRHVDLALDALAPAIDAPPVQVGLATGGVDAFGTGRNGALTVVAVNPSPTAVVSETFTVPGLAGRTVRTWNGGATIASSGDAFSDTLPPLAWRVYVVPPL